MSNKEQSPSIYKSNALIEASYRLGVIEQRILLTCLSQIRDNDSLSDDDLYSVSVKDIGEFTESDRKSLYDDLARAAQSLRRKGVMIFKEPNTGNKLPKVMETSWVQTAIYVPNEGRVELRFNRDMVPYLSQLQRQFTKYNLSDVIKMTSSNGIRMFELLVQYTAIGRRKILNDELRRYLGLEDSYPKIADLRRKVIDPAIEQVNEHSSLVVQHMPIFEGRRIIGFDFKIGWKNGRSPAKNALQGKSKGTPTVVEGQVVEGQVVEPAKKEAKPKSSVTLTKAVLTRHARPGESWEDCKVRLMAKLKRDGRLD